MLSHYSFLALDIANERTREADRHRLAALARSAAGTSASMPRRAAARAAATASRGLASLTRRLDGCTADELVDALRAERLATN
jgi:hypothetical protein